MHALLWSSVSLA